MRVVTIRENAKKKMENLSLMENFKTPNPYLYYRILNVYAKVNFNIYNFNFRNVNNLR